MTAPVQTPHPTPQGEAPGTAPHGAERSLRTSPLGATARRALALGECVVCDRSGNGVLRTSDPAEAERVARVISGYVVYPEAQATA